MDFSPGLFLFPTARDEGAAFTFLLGFKEVVTTGPGEDPLLNLFPLFSSDLDCDVDKDFFAVGPLCPALDVK